MPAEPMAYEDNAGGEFQALLDGIEETLSVDRPDPDAIRRHGETLRRLAERLDQLALNLDDLASIRQFAERVKLRGAS